MSRGIFVLIAVLYLGTSTNEVVFAQATPPSNASEATSKAKKKEELAREKQKAAEQWRTNSQIAMATLAATREKRRDCQRRASEQKLYFSKRSRFLRECMAAKPN